MYLASSKTRGLSALTSNPIEGVWVHHIQKGWGNFRSFVKNLKVFHYSYHFGNTKATKMVISQILPKCPLRFCLLGVVIWCKFEPILVKILVLGTSTFTQNPPLSPQFMKNWLKFLNFKLPYLLPGVPKNCTDFTMSYFQKYWNWCLQIS